MNDHSVVIIGAGGFGREVLETIRQLKDFHVLGYIDDNMKLGSKVNGYSVIGKVSWLIQRDRYLAPLGVVIAVGDPNTRQAIFLKLKHIKNLWFPSIIHQSVHIPYSTKIGDGTIIQNGCFVSCNVSIGRFTHINVLSVIGHDVSIGEFTTLSPGAKVMGNVSIGNRVFFGVNVCTDINLNIGNDVIIGAMSFVKHDVGKKLFVYGIPIESKETIQSEN